MIPKKQIETAKRADLPGILKAMGVGLVSNGKGYHLRDHDSLKLFQQEGIWLYKWWSHDGCCYRDKMDPFGRYVWTHL